VLAVSLSDDMARFQASRFVVVGWRNDAESQPDGSGAAGGRTHLFTGQPHVSPLPGVYLS